MVHADVARIPITPLGPAEIQQMIPIVVVASISIVAILGFTCRGFILSLFQGGRPAPSRETIFFRTQLGVYISCLAVANILSAIAGVMEAVWIAGNAVKENKTCTIQASLVVFSDFAIAWFTSVIAIHTYVSLILRYKTPLWTTSIVIGCGWFFAGLMAFIPPFVPPSKAGGPLYGNTTFICSIVRVYPMHQFLMHLLPMFLTALLSAILYFIIFLVLRGTLVMRGGIYLQRKTSNRWTHVVGTGIEEYHEFLVAIAWSMLWYPLAYLALATPTAMTLLLELSGFPVSWAAMVVATCFSQSLGLVNVIVVINTIRVLRPVISAASLGSKNPSRKIDDLESFGTPEYPSEKARSTFYSVNSGPPLRQLALTQPRASSMAESIGSQESSSWLVPQHRRQGSGSSPALYSQSPIARPAPARQPSLTGRYSPVARAAMHRPNVSTSAQGRPAYIGEAISPIAELNAQLGEPAEARAPAPLYQHARQYSTDSTRAAGLPPPPRAGRRSPVQRAPSVERGATPILAPLTPLAPVRTSASIPSAESMYSLYMQRTPETPEFQTMPVWPRPQASLSVDPIPRRKPGTTTAGPSNLPRAN